MSLCELIWNQIIKPLRSQHKLIGWLVGANEPPPEHVRMCVCVRVGSCVAVFGFGE